MMDDVIITSTTRIDDATIARITANGQISLPAAIRRRWGVQRVAIVDRGDLAVVRAVPDDPVAYFRGRYAGRGPNSSELRRQEQEAEEALALAKATRTGTR